MSLSTVPPSSPPSLHTLQSATQPPAKRAGPASPNEVDARDGKRVKTVTQACKDCRRNKAKCDGTRPKCGPCVHKGRDCGYEGEVGQSRQAAMKARLESLEKLFDTLQNKAPEDAERLLQRIRSADGLTSVLNLRGDGDDAADTAPFANWPPSHSTAWPPSSSSSWRPGGSLRLSEGGNNAADYASRPRGSFPGSWSSLSSLSSFSGPSSRGSRQISDASTLLVRVILPNLPLTTRAIDSFFGSTGQLFHVFSRAQIASYLDEIFGSDSPSPSANPKKAVCCVACVAAVGVQYNADDFEPGLDEVFYDVARHYFIDVFEACPLQSIKACSMLAMFNILKKSTVSVAYVEVGLGMCRRHSLNDRHYVYPGMTSEEWTDYRATWRCLIFFSTWLSSTLGYLSSEDIPLDALLPVVEAELGTSADITDTIQVEMTKISLLKADILRMRLATKDLTGIALEAVVADLQQWYNQLPQAMLLATLGQSDLPDTARRSIYYVHLLYLGAIMLLYRRVVAQFVQSFGVDYQRNMVSRTCEQVMLNHAEQGVVAAKTSSRVLGLLLGQTGCFKRCWVVIFQSYTSCVVLLHCVAQKQLHEMAPSSWEEELPQAKTCLDALEFCGTIDPVALKFHERLLPIFHTLSRYTPTPKILASPTKVSATWPAGVPPAFSSSSNTLVQGPATLPQQDQARHQNTEPDPQPHPFAYLLTIPASGNTESAKLSLTLLQTLSRPYDNPAASGSEHLAAGGDGYAAARTSQWPAQPSSTSCPPMGHHGRDSEWDMAKARAYRWNSAELCIPDAIAGPAATASARFLDSTTPSGWSDAI